MRIITFVLLACALATTAQAQQPAQIRGFSVVLLLGEQQGAIPDAGLSAVGPARHRGHQRNSCPTRAIACSTRNGSRASEVGASKGRIRGLENRRISIFTWTDGIRTARGFGSSVPGPGMASKGERLGDEMVLDNSFRIKPGETVVVGTSRVRRATAR